MCSDTKRKEKEELIEILTDALPILRASIGISQGELADFIGISRQTYCALEQKKRIMSWNTFLSLFLFFTSNNKANNLMKAKKGFIEQVIEFLQFDTCDKNDSMSLWLENT